MNSPLLARIFAICLSLSLALPSPALALRPAATPQSKAGTEELETALRPSRSKPEGYAVSAAGTEEILDQILQRVGSGQPLKLTDPERHAVLQGFLDKEPRIQAKSREVILRLPQKPYWLSPSTNEDVKLKVLLTDPGIGPLAQAAGAVREAQLERILRMAHQSSLRAIELLQGLSEMGVLGLVSFFDENGTLRRPLEGFDAARRALQSERAVLLFRFPHEFVDEKNDTQELASLLRQIGTGSPSRRQGFIKRLNRRDPEAIQSLSFAIQQIQYVGVRDFPPDLWNQEGSEGMRFVAEEVGAFIWLMDRLRELNIPLTSLRREVSRLDEQLEIEGNLIEAQKRIEAIRDSLLRQTPGRLQGDDLRQIQRGLNAVLVDLRDMTVPISGGGFDQKRTHAGLIDRAEFLLDGLSDPDSLIRRLREEEPPGENPSVESEIVNLLNEAVRNLEMGVEPMRRREAFRFKRRLAGRKITLVGTLELQDRSPWRFDLELHLNVTGYSERPIRTLPVYLIPLVEGEEAEPVEGRMTGGIGRDSNEFLYSVRFEGLPAEQWFMLRFGTLPEAVPPAAGTEEIRLVEIPRFLGIQIERPSSEKFRERLTAPKLQQVYDAYLRLLYREGGLGIPPTLAELAQELAQAAKENPITPKVLSAAVLWLQQKSQQERYMPFPILPEPPLTEAREFLTAYFRWRAAGFSSEGPEESPEVPCPVGWDVQRLKALVSQYRPVLGKASPEDPVLQKILDHILAAPGGSIPAMEQAQIPGGDPVSPVLDRIHGFYRELEPAELRVALGSQGDFVGAISWQEFLEYVQGEIGRDVFGSAQVQALLAQLHGQEEDKRRQFVEELDRRLRDAAEKISAEWARSRRPITRTPFSQLLKNSPEIYPLLILGREDLVDERIQGLGLSLDASGSRAAFSADSSPLQAERPPFLDYLTLLGIKVAPDKVWRADGTLNFSAFPPKGQTEQRIRRSGWKAPEISSALKAMIGSDEKYKRYMQQWAERNVPRPQGPVSRAAGTEEMPLTEENLRWAVSQAQEKGNFSRGPACWFWRWLGQGPLPLEFRERWSEPVVSALVAGICSDYSDLALFSHRALQRAIQHGMVSEAQAAQIVDPALSALIGMGRREVQAESAKTVVALAEKLRAVRQLVRTVPMLETTFLDTSEDQWAEDSVSARRSAIHLVVAAYAAAGIGTSELERMIDRLMREGLSHKSFALQYACKNLLATLALYPHFQEKIRGTPATTPAIIGFPPQMSWDQCATFNRTWKRIVQNDHYHALSLAGRAFLRRLLIERVLLPGPQRLSDAVFSLRWLDHLTTQEKIDRLLDRPSLGAALHWPSRRFSVEETTLLQQAADISIGIGPHELVPVNLREMLDTVELRMLPGYPSSFLRLTGVTEFPRIPEMAIHYSVGGDLGPDLALAVFALLSSHPEDAQGDTPGKLRYTYLGHPLDPVTSEYDPYRDQSNLGLFSLSLDQPGGMYGAPRSLERDLENLVWFAAGGRNSPLFQRAVTVWQASFQDEGIAGLIRQSQQHASLSNTRLGHRDLTATLELLQKQIRDVYHAQPHDPSVQEAQALVDAFARSADETPATKMPDQAVCHAVRAYLQAQTLKELDTARKTAFEIIQRAGNGPLIRPLAEILQSAPPAAGMEEEIDLQKLSPIVIGTGMEEKYPPLAGLRRMPQAKVFFVGPEAGLEDAVLRLMEQGAWGAVFAGTEEEGRMFARMAAAAGIEEIRLVLPNRPDFAGFLLAIIAEAGRVSESVMAAKESFSRFVDSVLTYAGQA